MRKKEELIAGCMAKAMFDEMTFTLLARDLAAPETIRFWIRRRIELGLNDPQDQQLFDAAECASVMDHERDAVRQDLGKQ